MNANLMIAHTEVKLGEYLSTFELFEKLIDVGKWVLVLYSLLVQWMVVNTKSVRSILLLHKRTPQPHEEELGRMRPIRS